MRKRLSSLAPAALMLFFALPARADNTWHICGKLTSALKGNGYRDWWYLTGDERTETGDPENLAIWVMRSARENGLFVSPVGWKSPFVFESALYPNVSGAKYAITTYNTDESQDHTIYQGNKVLAIPDTMGFTVTVSVCSRTETYTFMSDGKTRNNYYRDCWYLKKAVIESQNGVLTAEAADDGLTFSDGERRVCVPTQQSLYCFSMANFPHTMQEAEAVAALWREADIPCLINIFTYYGRGLPSRAVYLSPADDAARGGNGKASVALRSGFNRYDLADAAGSFQSVSLPENGRTMIEYENDEGVWRFGWIEAQDMPNGDTKDLPVKYPVTLLQDTHLTDDPLRSNRALAPLAKGERVVLRAALGLHWLYAETTAGGGSPVGGFIPMHSVLPDSVLTEESPKTTATVKTASGSLNLRAKPFSDAEITARIPNQTAVNVQETGTDYCCVEYGTFCGFVMTKYLLFK